MPRVSHDPKTDDGLKAVCEVAISGIDPEDKENLAKFLVEVDGTTDEDRADPKFQKRAWSSILVFDGGLMSETEMDTLLSDGFCQWFAEETAQVPRGDADQRTKSLKLLLEEALLREQSVLGFKPHVETLRTLALFFPASFTGLANKMKLKQLADALDLKVAGADPVQANRLILDRIESVLGPPEESFEGIAQRILTAEELHWHLCDEPRLWGVRAGREDQDEEYVLANGVAILGFKDEPAPDTDDAKAFVEVVHKKHPGWTKKKAKMTADQIWNFAWEIQKRDIVVLPRKRGKIAWGTVEGEYEHREVNGTPRHTRPVKWVHTDIPRKAFGDDEKYLNRPSTVFSLHKHAERLLPVLTPPDKPPSDDPRRPSMGDLWVDLKTNDGLRTACSTAQSRLSERQVREVAAFLEQIRGASREERASETFQIRLWTFTTLWRGGLMARRNRRPHWLKDERFRIWFADRSLGAPEDRDKRIEFLTNFNTDLRRSISEGPYQGEPRVEILRALALLFPEDFTAVARQEKLTALAKAMGCQVGDDRPVLANRLVLDRLREVLGAPSGGFEAAATRLLLASRLYWLAFPQLWAVRAGKHGQDEEFVLSKNFAMLGFEEEPAPETYNYKEYRDLVRGRDSARSNRRSDSAARQVWDFAWGIHEGDIVLLPQKKGRRHIAWGTVESEYERRAIKRDSEPRHIRSVRWVRKDLPRKAFGEGRTFLDLNRTVFSLREHADRIWPKLNGLEPLPSGERLILLAFHQDDDFAWLRWMLDLVDAEITRDALHAKLTEKKHPNWSPATTDFKVAAAGVLRCVTKEGDSIKVTRLGHQIREEDDPDTLMDRILTGIRGGDHALVWLGDGSQSKSALVGDLRSRLSMSSQAASDLVRFLQDLDVLEMDDSGNLTLTERGARWRKEIHWTPELLAPEPPPVSLPVMDDLWDALTRQTDESNLMFDRKLVEELHLGLWSNEQRHFAILSGLSGTGKTQIARHYAMALTGTEADTSERVKVITVHPGWHDPGSLLGFVNPLTGDFTRTEFLEFLLKAARDPKQAHVVILDEMNLSHPEQYFAPILSAMEIFGHEIPLHSGDPNKMGVPNDVTYPRNLAIIGTVNMDETTMGISDKVLDRAFTLDFWNIEPGDWPGWEASGLDDNEKTKVRTVLTGLTKALSPARCHFGWRVIAEVVGFLKARAADPGIEINADAALDQVIYAKVLPKLRGSDTRRFRQCLDTSIEVLKRHELPTCTRRVEELKEDLEATGSCSFWR